MASEDLDITALASQTGRILGSLGGAGVGLWLAITLLPLFISAVASAVGGTGMAIFLAVLIGIVGISVLASIGAGVGAIALPLIVGLAFGVYKLAACACGAFSRCPSRSARRYKPLGGGGSSPYNPTGSGHHALHGPSTPEMAPASQPVSPQPITTPANFQQPPQPPPTGQRQTARARRQGAFTRNGG